MESNETRDLVDILYTVVHIIASLAERGNYYRICAVTVAYVVSGA